ncbi:hypothetical protein JW868_02305 [Candidatus Woesearchaeota archaeon]|nr:hypothetical protein [Candidatus Woesearchaeota archaeon]
MDQKDFDDLLRIQRMMASRIVQESSVNNKIKLLDIINNMVTDKNKKVQIENVIIEAMNEGMTERETTDLIDQLKKDHLVYETSPGFLQRTKDMDF